jgi:molybdopterin molybdotransferase
MGRLSIDWSDAAPAPMRVADAVALIRARLPVLSGIERVPLARAAGRVLAEDLIAPIHLPPFDNAAVDGYALRAADLAAAGETRLPLGGRVPAGHVPCDTAPGAAVRIFTGAPMPPGTDTVAMQEDVRAEGAVVLLPAGLAPGANRRRTGEDVARGSVAIRAGASTCACVFDRVPTARPRPSRHRKVLSRGSRRATGWWSLPRISPQSGSSMLCRTIRTGIVAELLFGPSSL